MEHCLCLDGYTQYEANVKNLGQNSTICAKNNPYDITYNDNPMVSF